MTWPDDFKHTKLTFLKKYSMIQLLLDINCLWLVMKTEEKAIEKVKFVNQYSSQILTLIDNQEELTRGDLQGGVEAVVLQIIHALQSSRLINYH